MRKNRKLISIISAAALLTSAMPMTGLVASARNVQGLFDTYEFNDEYSRMCPIIKENSNEENDNLKYDFNGDSNFDFKDYKIIQRAINKLYADNKFDFSKIISTESQEDVTIDGYPLSADDLDVTDDEKISVEDYCVLLRYLQKNFVFNVHEGECYAVINGYLKHPSEAEKEVKSLIVPSEVYYRGKIVPVMSIQGDAFSNLPELENITFMDYRQPQWVDPFNVPLDSEMVDNVTASFYLHIHDNAFKDCNSLKKIKLPYHVVLDSQAFANSGLEDHYRNIGNIRYFISDNGMMVACKKAGNPVDSNGTLAFDEGTTSINPDFLQNNSAVTNVKIPSLVKYIGKGAFKGCSNLATVNGKSYSDFYNDNKNFINAYLGSFIGTEFLTTATEEKITEIANIVRRDTDFETVNALGRYIFENVYYSGFDSYGGDNPKYNNGLASPFNYGNNNLYVTAWYNSRNYCRSSIEDSYAGILLDATECVGFSYATSLILDELGIPNYSVGPYIEPEKEEEKKEEEKKEDENKEDENKEDENKKKLEGTGVAYGHAYNIVYVDGKWYELDLSSEGDREFKRNKEGERIFEDKGAYLNSLKSYEFLTQIKKGAIAGREQFKFYNSSKNEQFYEGEYNYIPSSDGKIIYIETDFSNISQNPQYKVLRKDLAAGIVKFKS